MPRAVVPSLNSQQYGRDPIVSLQNGGMGGPPILSQPSGTGGPPVPPVPCVDPADSERPSIYSTPLPETATASPMALYAAWAM